MTRAISSSYPEAVRELTLVIATRNAGKTKELRTFLKLVPGIRVVSLLDFPMIDPVPETGSSFAENAVLKACGYSTKTNMFAIADDSGLEVDALEGRPGILSARYGGEGVTDEERIRLLLAELDRINGNRHARFRSCVALADEKGQLLHVTEGSCEGTIARDPRGHNGFGYDPIFVPAGYDLTFGELSSAIKDQISHRAKAFSLMKDFLLAHLNHT